MHRPSLTISALIGGLTALPLLALSFFGEKVAGFGFMAFDLFDWLARTLPGDIVTLGIDTLVHLVTVLNLGPTDTVGKRMEQLMSLVMVAAGGALLGAVIGWIRGRTNRPAWHVGAGVGLVAFLLLAYVELDLGFVSNAVASLLWLAALVVGWGALVGKLSADTDSAPVPADDVREDRRAALVKIAGGSLGVALGAWGLGRLLQTGDQATGAGQPLTNLRTATPETQALAEPTPTRAGAAPTEPAPTAATTAEPMPEVTAVATARDRIEPAPGTRPEITPTEDFYRIDINTRPVVIEGKSWVLEVGGLFDNPRPLTLEDMMAFASVTQPVTMSCISNRVGGDLIGTSLWTGVRLRDVLKDLGLRPEAKQLYIEAADGFFESVTLEDMMDPRTLLVYGMNGETLPVEHGFPLRIYIPNRYGMKQPKWITRIEAIEEERLGYWVQRGWSKEARPHIVSVIDTVATDNIVDGKVPIGGIAWAGDRGIQKVEVQVNREEWHEAVIRKPPLSGLTWMQWRYDWPMEPGRYEFRVRATDGTGALQIEEESPPAPDGATGYHRVVASI